MKRFFCLRLDAAFWTAFQTVSLNGKTSGLDFLRLVVSMENATTFGVFSGGL